MDLGIRQPLPRLRQRLLRSLQHDVPALDLLLLRLVGEAGDPAVGVAGAQIAGLAFGGPPGEEAESGRAALGRALTFLREKAGLSLGQLAMMEDLDRFYETGGLLVELWKVARREVFKDKVKGVHAAGVRGAHHAQSEAESVEEQVTLRKSRTGVGSATVCSRAGRDS
ncbi:hypothetical protein [Streptomyces microflavus]|uniref:hypothetical protein n=1 Tax=Streptomyces microflavus TaxID=1919 RepID=UPI003651B2F6